MSTTLQQAHTALGLRMWRVRLRLAALFWASALACLYPWAGHLAQNAHALIGLNGVRHA